MDIQKILRKNKLSVITRSILKWELTPKSCTHSLRIGRITKATYVNMQNGALQYFPLKYAL